MSHTTSPIPLSCFQNEGKVFAITVKDSAGVLVDLTPFTSMRFVVYDNNSPPNPLFKSESIAVGGTGNSVASVTTTGADTALGVREYRWILWNVTGGADDVLAHGPLTIRPGLIDTV